LKGGLLVDGLSMKWCRRLLKEEKGVLTEIGVHVGFQCAVGMNGRAWVDAGDVARTILVARAIREAEELNEEDTRKLVRELVLKL
jgi:exosome complex component RRP40